MRKEHASIENVELMPATLEHAPLLDVSNKDRARGFAAAVIFHTGTTYWDTEEVAARALDPSEFAPLEI